MNGWLDKSLDAMAIIFGQTTEAQIFSICLALVALSAKQYAMIKVVKIIKFNIPEYLFLTSIDQKLLIRCPNFHSFIYSYRFWSLTIISGYIPCIVQELIVSINLLVFCSCSWYNETFMTRLIVINDVFNAVRCDIKQILFII